VIPVRLLILGEKLIGFRDSSGRVGILDQQCPHRCASLFFGRNEHDGLRCVYHGWKFDVDGNCLEMPNVIPPWDFSPRVKAKAYRTTERMVSFGHTWEARRSLLRCRSLRQTLLPSDLVTSGAFNANAIGCKLWRVTSTHHTSAFLHMGSISGDDVDPLNMHSYAVTNRQPLYHVRKLIGAPCTAGTEMRIRAYLLPFRALCVSVLHPLSRRDV